MGSSIVCTNMAIVTDGWISMRGGPCQKDKPCDQKLWTAWYQLNLWGGEEASDWVQPHGQWSNQMCLRNETQRKLNKKAQVSFPGWRYSGVLSYINVLWDPCFLRTKASCLVCSQTLPYLSLYLASSDLYPLAIIKWGYKYSSWVLWYILANYQTCKSGENCIYI